MTPEGLVAAKVCIVVVGLMTITGWLQLRGRACWITGNSNCACAVCERLRRLRRWYFRDDHKEVD